MKIIKNETLINRNSKIGQWTSIGAVVVLGGGMYISFTRPELFTVSLVCLLLGFIMSQVGMYMGNRWGRSPRHDEKLDAGLKGLHSEFNIYHYSSPVSHLLVGPAGIWVLIPYHQRGQVYFEKNRWKIKGGGLLQGYMRVFGQEGLGRPELEAESQVDVLRKFFKKHMEETNVPEIKVALVFTNEQVELDAGESSIPAMKLKQLKEFIRQMSKSRALTNQQITEITSLLPKE
jgi:hypothetical protein